MAIAVDDSDNVYVSGYCGSASAVSDYATIMYDNDGKELWVVTYHGDLGGYDSAQDIAVNNLGGVYVTGESHGNYVTIKYVQQPPVEATVDFKPDTLNLKSKGKWVTAYIEFPDNYVYGYGNGYDVQDIDIGTVMLNETIPAERGDVQDSVLMVKFDRSDVQDLLEPGDNVEIAVSGALTDGTPFEGADTIRVKE